MQGMARMNTKEMSKKDNIFVFSGVDGTIASIDLTNRTINFGTCGCAHTYNLSQITSVNFNIERDDLFLYGTRKLISQMLLLGPFSQILKQSKFGLKIRRMGLALCQRQFIRKISHEIIIDNGNTKTHELIFLQGPHRCGSQKVKDTLHKSGVWLNFFAKITRDETAICRHNF